MITNDSIKSNIDFKNKLNDIGGLKPQLDRLLPILELYLNNNNNNKFGQPKGILLYGPPGTGKTMLAHSLANYNNNIHKILVNAPELISKFIGESEAKIQALFDEAKLNQPSIICIDEIDAICPNRTESTSQLDNRIVATFLTLMDGIDDNNLNKVLIIGTTNRINSIDLALRRPGRFDIELEIGVPTSKDRLDILLKLLNNTPNELNLVEIETLANKLHGYVGADLNNLVKEAGLLAIKNFIELNEAKDKQLKISLNDMELAFRHIKPSAMREVMVEIPKVHWNEIGGQSEVQIQLQESIELPLTQPELFTQLKITPPKGILLYGPPGCSKTLMAKAIATSSNVNFLLVKGPELLDKYVGESEKKVRAIFQKARMVAPCLIFFDEIDALASKRSTDGSSGGVKDRVLAQFLTEMDGVNPLQNVTILAATNRPDIIDPALLRPGRIDRKLYIGPPDYQARKDIFSIQSKRMPFHSNIDLDYLANMTNGCSGAEVVGLCQDAAMKAMERDVQTQEILSMDFQSVLNQGLKRNITFEMLEFYRKFRENQIH